MADDPKTRTVTLKTPSGKIVDFVVGADWSHNQIERLARQKKPELFVRPGVPGPPPMEMKESKLPGLVRAASSVIPVATGLGGAVAGSGLGPAGTVAGGGLGAAGGEAAHEAIDNALFSNYRNPRTGANIPGDRPDTLKQALTKTGLAGATGAVSEAPGALATAIGDRLISRIALMKDPKEVGDAVRSLIQEAPAGFSGRGLLFSLQKSYRAASSDLGRILSRPVAPTSVDRAIGNSRLEAQLADATVPGTLRRFDRMIAAAKQVVGIRGRHATPDQMFKLMKELGEEAYAGNPGPVGQVLKGLLKKSYDGLGSTLRVTVPDADPILTRLTNLHAAESALKRYHPGVPASTAVTAALHPRTTAALSPAVTGAVIAGASKAGEFVRKIAGEILP